MSTLSDSEFEDIRKRLNLAIHEIVFAVQHLEQDDFDDACTCLTTAGGTIESVQERLVQLG